MTSIQGSAEDLEFLLSPGAIRARSECLFDRAFAGNTHFFLRLGKLNEVAGLVAKVTRKNYPALNIPYHSRWGHFRAAGVDRNAILEKRMADQSSDERVKAKLDLVLVSVLLDAGAGAGWRYVEGSGEATTARSEGLAVATWNMFAEGLFSSDKTRPHRVDAEGLAKVDESALARGFQISAANRMEGFEGRAALLHALAKALESGTGTFGSEGRPGGMLDTFRSLARGRTLAAPQILRVLQRGLGAIWPGRDTLETPDGAFNLGDAWHYPPLGRELSVGSIVPFHKLFQWLAYSLFEPLEEAGLTITGADELTGLAEYRNGGLMLDSGLIGLRDESQIALAHHPGSELIIEWRALTVRLLDLLADPVRERLGVSQADFPLAKILEGGTWWAGRKLAAGLRSDGRPPLKVLSDGTVF